MLHHLQCKVLVQLICNRLLTQKCLVHPKEDLNFTSWSVQDLHQVLQWCHAYSGQWQCWWRHELCSCWNDERLSADTETEKQSNSSTISFPPDAKPFPKQQLARWVGPYLRRAAGGEALIGDWGGWRLSGWWASLIAVLLEGRGLASTNLHTYDTQLLKNGMREGISCGAAHYI